MKDLFNNYHKHKVLQHAGILAFSLVMALGINMFVLSSDTAGILKANVLEAQQTESQKSDIYSKISESSVELLSSQSMQGVNELSLTLAYNPEIKISDIQSSIEMQMEKIQNSDGFIILLFTAKTPVDISEKSSLISLKFSNTLESGTNIINVINANFTDNESEIYNLSSESIIF